jgi:hypothetical protein
LLASGVVAHAATVQYGETKAGGGSIVPVGSGVSSIASDNGAYAAPPESGDGGDPADWVWVGDTETTDTAEFEFTFDLTGLDLTSVVLRLDWSVDNFGWVELDAGDGAIGTPDDVATLPDVTGNFASIDSVTLTGASNFQPGENTLTFYLRDRFFDTAEDGGQAAFTAAVAVTATPIPLPASLPLVVGGIAALGLLRARRKKS